MSEPEKERLLNEYRRREREIPAGRYAPWDPAEMMLRSERKRLAATLLHKSETFPTPETPCLEVGYGRLGWLADLISWGVREESLSGIELDGERAAAAQALLPRADLRVGDASALPWHDDSFGLVITSTVFSSILDEEMRLSVAAEIVRVLQPGGAFLCYDFRLDNPRNNAVRGVGRRDLQRLFPGLKGEIRSTTLAPPLARWLAPKSFRAAFFMEALPFLRTHLIAVLRPGPVEKKV